MTFVPVDLHGLGIDQHLSGTLDTGQDRGNRGRGVIEAYGGNNTKGRIDVAPAVNAHGGPQGRQDFASETFVASPLTGRPYADNASQEDKLLPIAFSACDSGDDASIDISGTLRSLAHDKSHANSGSHMAIAWDEDLNASEDQAGTVMRGGDGGRHDGVMSAMQVRRLTPIECERLQGFPDNYTQIPRGKKSAEQCADGPRYKALGNSMAVPVMAWLGQRIQMVEDVID